MSRRKGALALVAVLADLAVSSCAGARRWTEDESGRIDAIMAGAGADAGTAAGGEAEGLGLAMGPAPPLAEPTRPGEQLGPGTPWSQRPRRRGKRFYLGYRSRAPAVGRDEAREERSARR